jgi:hypothetical protein
MFLCLAPVNSHLLMAIEAVFCVCGVPLKLDAAPKTRSGRCFAAPWFFLLQDFKRKLNDSLSESV